MMKCCLPGLLAAWCCLCFTDAAAVDELTALRDEIAPEARFAGHVPQFSVIEETRQFQFSNGTQAWDFWVIKDGERVVAYVPKKGFHGGSIFLLTHDPALAKTVLTLPTERFHIDTAPGCSFRTDHFLPSKNWNEGGEESVWEVADDGSKVTLKRRYQGELKSYKWELDTRKSPLQVDHEGTFAISLDPVYGYVVDGRWQTGVDSTRNLGQYVSLYPPDMSNPWVTEDKHQRVMTTPIGSSGYIGHANNHPAIDRSDNDRKKWNLRDGGFTSYLNQGKWSWTLSVRGGSANLSVCNVHADQDVLMRWPKELEQDEQGLTRHTVHARLLRMPPEMTDAVWSRTEMMFDGGRIVVIPLGKQVDFEAQPVSMGEMQVGMAFGGGGPEISTGEARSGSKSLVVKGRVFPNLPQVVLKPGQRYRLEGWYKVVPPSEDDIEELRKRHEKSQASAEKRWQRQVRKAEKQGKPAPPKPEQKAWVRPERSEAYITAHLYKWSPHNIGDRLVNQTTTKASDAEAGWQLVELEFTAPEWGPFVDIRFMCEGGGTAYLDDFALIELD